MKKKFITVSILILSIASLLISLILEVTKKWTIPLCNFGNVYGELSIMYEVRL